MAGAAVLAAFAALGDQPAQPDISVHVEKAGDRVLVRVSLLVETSPERAWSVLTDYDHMSRFVSNVHSSTVLSRSGNTLEVAQKGKASRGPLSISFDNVREVVLVPGREIRSRMIRGDLKSSEFTTRIAPEGSGTRVVNEGEFIPDRWVPPFVGPALIEAETRKQWQELREEMLRRQGAPAADAVTGAQR
jgi:hypothetical protein